MKRTLPFLAVALALLAAAWWGIDTFVLSADEVPDGGGHDPIFLDVATGEADSGGGAVEEDAIRVPWEPVGRAGRTTDASSVEEGGPATPDTPNDQAGRTADGHGAEDLVDVEPPSDGGGRSTGLTTTSTHREVRVGNQGVTPPGAETWVRPGIAWIGTPPEQVRGMEGARSDGSLQALAYEAPRHALVMEGFWIERTEATNQRYWRFLKERAGVEFRTPLGNARTLTKIVQTLVGPRAPSAWDVEVTAHQLYETNQAVLHGALPRLVVIDPSTRNLDAEATWENFREVVIPDDLDLRFYDRAPPRTWPDWMFVPGREMYPVRDLSLEDATAFAAWAGRHVPTEIEWEYAARGPQGQDLPWGSRSAPRDDVVNGGERRARDEPPETVPVTALPASASWVDCVQMLGNVAEWTSSWLDPYPDSPLAPQGVAVTRGGSAFNQDPLAVRTAFRGWSNAEHQLNVVLSPTAHRWWSGVRLARYEEPARSRTVGMRTAVRLGREVDPAALEPYAYAGVEGWLLREAFPSRQDPTVRMGAKAVVVQPLRAVTTYRDVPPPRWRPGVPVEVVTEGGLFALSASQPVRLGLLAIDFEVLHVYALGKLLRDGRRRLTASTLPPGTWELALHQGHLAALTPAADGMGMVYLTRRPVGQATLRVLKRGRGADAVARPQAHLEFRPRTGRARIELITPLGNEEHPALAARLAFDLQFEARVTQAIVDWEEGRLPE